ncbi:nucleotidyltransferase domain-containing protein [Burkholderia cepacia]|uniref:nucleotidyltransferase domain-containing protein n=1 Tax=Burkholderia cepacia TaxID=292 RepID=UPI002AB79C0D|nr:nucleotidyltransferase [Burkholderia cepacia]
MAIPEDQLATWAKIGAQATSRDTYASVRRALLVDGTGYHDKLYSIFLQGSYGNDTNIWRESDVDIVIQLDSVFTYELGVLPPMQQLAFHAGLVYATYSYEEYRADVLAALRQSFGDTVEPGAKAVSIEPSGNRRKADVLIAMQHRNYWRYTGGIDSLYVEGISFHKGDGTQVVNYPRQHRENLVAKNQATNEWFKHIVRIFKNARERMIEQGLLAEGVAPSYYIEGLLYNVPTYCFGNAYQATVLSCLNWLCNVDRTKFLCANSQYMLLNGNVNVTWNSRDCDAFLRAFVLLWNGW